MGDDAPKDNNEPAGGGDSDGEGGYDRAPWTLPELRVMLERLDGRMNTTEERLNTTKAENRHEFERLGTRLTFVMLGVGGLIIASVGVLIAVFGNGAPN